MVHHYRYKFQTTAVHICSPQEFGVFSHVLLSCFVRKGQLFWSTKSLSTVVVVRFE